MTSHIRNSKCISATKTLLLITTPKGSTMNSFFKVSSNLSVLLVLPILMALTSCGDAKTSSDAPKTTESTEKVSAMKDGKATQDDAQNETRKKQLEADIRAREQRNNMGGDSNKRAVEDLSSEVRSKLEANIPKGKLTVSAKDSEVTVSGVVGTKEELDKIKFLAMEIKGVTTVVVKAVVSP
jgi:hyperosmotically inducible periplasmic protein